MKVNSIAIENFKGIEKYNHDFDKTVTVVTGKNGSGKTSFIEALRYAITNETPSNPINAGSKTADVAIVCDDDTTIERHIVRPLSKTSKIMGRTAGVSASKGFIEDKTSVPAEVMKLATSSETLASLKPSSFGSIFLNESMEDKSLEDLLEIFKTCSLKDKIAVIEDDEEKTGEGYEYKLPSDVLAEIKTLFKGKSFNMDAIQEAYEKAKDLKKERNAQYSVLSAKAKDFKDIVRPEYNEDELNKKYDEIVGVEKSVSVYKEQVRQYNEALERKNAQDKRLSELDLAISTNKAVKPDEKELESLNAKIASLNKEIVDSSKVQQTLSDNRKWFTRTLEQLDKPVCPISEKLICSTDKTGLRSDLEKQVEDLDLSLSVVSDKIEELKKLVAETNSKISSYNRNKENWNRKELQKKERDSLLASPIKVPEKPETFESKKDYTAQKKEIKDKLNQLHQYRIAEQDYIESLKVKRQYDVADFLVKALDPKGPVVREFISTFTDCLEDACNERAELLKSGLEVKFIPEDGLKVLFKVKGDSGTFLPYENLSSGEKILASVVLTDLINSFYDSRILILDNTDQLDDESFENLLNFVTESSLDELYDNIVIACVDHDDLLGKLGDDIDIVRF